jgi:Aminoglycoside adenylyltransferase, C-terminal domain/Nucleotidyltransferase domain
MPARVSEALAVWLAAHDEAAPGTIEGLYVVGSVALADWTSHSDIDVVAVVADPSDADLVEDLAAAHALVRQRVDVAIDGPYVAWGDLVVPPAAVQRPWVLHGEYHVDGESFEINPVTWYTLAAYGLAARGVPAEQIGVSHEIGERRSWVAENIDTYWRGVADVLSAGLAESDEAEWGGEILEWVALGVARMLYTFETGDVASKSGAGIWAAERVPRHDAVFRRAVAVRADPSTVTRRELEQCAEVAHEIVVAVTGR